MTPNPAELAAPGAGASPVGGETKAPDELLDAARALLAAPSAIEALWARVNDLNEHRKLDPELRKALLRLAEKISLAGHFTELVEDKPAMGAFPRRDSMEAPTVEEWLREDPRRLRGVTLEIARFSSDDRVVAEAVLSLAEAVGIDQRLAIDVTAHALRDARQHRAVAR
jgi:hypothetical protein